MQKFDYPILIIASIVPIIISIFWFNDKAFGKYFNIDSRTTIKSNSIGFYVVLLILSFLFSLMLQFVTIHQFHLYSIVAGDPGMADVSSQVYYDYSRFLKNYSQNYRTFQHGAIHGLLLTIFTIAPVLIINSLVENIKFKKTALLISFWGLCSMIMGGIICQFTNQ